MKGAKTLGGTPVFKSRVAIFRGTDSLEDFDSDQDIFQVPYPFVEHAGRTHRGVTCIYSSTRNKLVRQLNKLSTQKRLFITGHSLGGALANAFCFRRGG